MLVSGRCSMWGSMGFDGEGSKKLMEWGGPWHISQSGVFGPFGRFGPFETVVVCSFLKFFFFFFFCSVFCTLDFTHGRELNPFQFPANNCDF